MSDSEIIAIINHTERSAVKVDKLIVNVHNSFTGIYLLIRKENTFISSLLILIQTKIIRCHFGYKLQVVKKSFYGIEYQQLKE